jgi:hypothetical protein
MKKSDEIKSKIQTIKTALGTTKKLPENLSENVLKDLPTTDKLFGKKLDEFTDKRKKKIENKKDIFSELIDVVETFITKNNKNTVNDRYGIKTKVKNIAFDSMKITANSTKDIVLNNVVKVFFVGEGICGTNSLININSIQLKPSEIDFMDVLTIDPNSDSGIIIYEPVSPNINKQKVNRKLFDSFTSGPYNFVSNNNKILFTTEWDSTNQTYNISGLQQSGNVDVETFFLDYYSSIELPDITGITKNAILLTLQPGDSVPLKFKNGINNLDKLVNKLFAICGNSTNRDNIKNQNPVNLFSTNEEDESTYFDFDNTEGVDFSLEDARYRSVLKFVDCDNFEVPVNENILEDFVYFADKKNIENLIDETLDKAGDDASEQSNSNIPKENFKLSLINNFILNLPKSLIMSIVTPKVFLPVVIIYKMFKSLTSQVLLIKDLMKRLFKLFSAIIKDIFWKFITEFWKRIKVELLKFVREIVTEIIKSKYARYFTILNTILLLLKKFNVTSINNCQDLFGTILSVIDKTLASKSNINIPGFLLGFSDKLPGFSKESALLNVIQRFEASGIPTGPIYNEENNIPKIMKSFMDGFFEELDKNSFVKSSNKEVTIPTPVGPIKIPPGIINSAGKLF